MFNDFLVFFSLQQFTSCHQYTHFQTVEFHDMLISELHRFYKQFALNENVIIESIMIAFS